MVALVPVEEVVAERVLACEADCDPAWVVPVVDAVLAPVVLVAALAVGEVPLAVEYCPTQLLISKRDKKKGERWIHRERSIILEKQSVSRRKSCHWQRKTRLLPLRGSGKCPADRPRSRRGRRFPCLGTSPTRDPHRWGTSAVWADNRFLPDYLLATS